MSSRSCELFREACKLVPGGVNSPVRACRNVNATPLFIDHASGSHLWDVDGREYIDFVMSWGPLLLGHAEPSVTRAIREAADKGSSFGAPCPSEVELARMVVEAMPDVEMVRMVNSGTEATMTALRLARGVTGRAKLLKFIGCYHGHADPFLAAAGSGVATLSIPGTPGVPVGVVEDTLLVPYNDLAAAAAVFDKAGDEIAAVIVEPVAANMGLVPPLPDFLEGLRQLTRRHKALLVFDEVITGFRLDYGGAQKRFAIDPDLTTMGKIIGGGLPVGCIGGRKKYMEQLAPAGSIYQAGTLSGNPLAMAAGIATLKKLRDENYKQLESRTAAFAKSLCDVLRDKGIPAQVPSLASMFAIFFTENPVVNFAEAKACDTDRYASFYGQMREKGIYLPPSPFETCMVSFAHTDADFERALEAAAQTSL